MPESSVSLQNLPPSVVSALQKIRTFADSARVGCDRARAAVDKANAFVGELADSRVLGFLEKMTGVSPIANAIIYLAEAADEAVDILDTGVDALDTLLDAVAGAPAPALPQAGV